MPPLSSPGDRVVRNEAVFRQVNERVRDVSEAFAALDPSPVDFVCECGLRACTEPVALQLHEYEAVRSHGSYVVVEKLPGEQDVARATDPRS